MIVNRLYTYKHVIVKKTNLSIIKNHIKIKIINLIN